MRGQEPEELTAIAVTDGIFRALRVQPELGRIFTAEDIDAGSPAVLILSSRYWRDRMGSDPQVIGQSILIGGNPNEIVGVMPAGFRLLDQDPDLYLTLQYNRASLTVTNFVFPSLARLREGTTLDGAVTELATLIPLGPERYPGGMTLELLQEARGVPVLHPLKDEVVGSVGHILWVVLGGVGIILIVACANVANLLLVRAESRERAMAVQSALGSPRNRLVGQSLAESLVLGLFGGGLGVGLAFGGLRLLRLLGPSQLPRLHEIGLDPGVLLFALSISLLSGLVLGLLPLSRTLRMELVGSLKEGGRGFSSGKERNRARNTLVVAQLALALVLLVGSGLMIRSFVALGRVNPGYSDPQDVLTFRLSIGSSDVRDPEQVAAAHEAMARQIADLPGVTSVGLSTSIPMDGAGGFDPIFVEDFPLPEGQQPQIRRFKWIGGGYHQAMGNPVIAGRPISWIDIQERTRVVMITESIAREFWGDPSLAVGRRLSTGYGPGDWREIIGVVGDVRDDGIEQPPVDIVYWPMVIEGYWSEIRGDALFFQRTMKYAVRSPRVGTRGFLEEVRDLIWASYPTRPLVNIRTMGDIQRSSMARSSFTLVMLGIAAAVALLLGSIGIYGVISYTVGQRTQELGLRIAMGAEPGAVTGMVLRQGLTLAVIGAAFGLGGAVGATRLMEAILFGVDPVDPPTYGMVAVALVGVALLSTYFPARRAAQVDPMIALRAE
jgi:predicted permease